MSMPKLDFSDLTVDERLNLIDEIWGSIDFAATPLTDTQIAELDQRIAFLDASPGSGRDAFEVLADFRHRFG